MKAIKWIFICLAFAFGGLCAYAIMPQKSVPVQEFAGKNSHFIQVKGRQLHYEQFGAGPPLVLVHGFAGSSYTWRLVAPLLAETHTVYALDLPGFGLSDKSPEASYDLRSQAAAVADFVTELSLSRVILAGHSMGGVVVGIAAARYPEKIERVILVDAGFYHGSPPKFIRNLFFPFDVVMARSFYTKGARSNSLKRSYLNQSLITDDLVEHYLRPARTPNAADVLVKMMRTSAAESYEGISDTIRIPTLIIWARQDGINPLEDADRLHKEIAGSQLVVIDRSGHMVQEEQPKQVANAMRAFTR